MPEITHQVFRKPQTVWSYRMRTRDSVRSLSLSKPQTHSILLGICSSFWSLQVIISNMGKCLPCSVAITLYLTNCYHYLGKGIYLSQDHPLPLCFIRLATQSNTEQRLPVKFDAASPKSSSFPCLFHLLQTPCFPWLIAPFSTFKTKQCSIFKSLNL